MGRIFVLGLVVALVILALGRGFVSSSDGGSVDGQREEAGDGLVELPEARVSSEQDTRGPSPAAGSGGFSFEGGGSVYLEETQAFGREYVEVIGETGALIRELSRRSRRVAPLSQPEASRLAELLSRMEDAPEAGVVISYPKGYGECQRYMRAGAYSLHFAAEAIREFIRKADAEKLDEYSDLVGMHLQSMSSAKSCVADHLYPHMRQ